MRIASTTWDSQGNYKKGGVTPIHRYCNTKLNGVFYAFLKAYGFINSYKRKYYLIFLHFLVQMKLQTKKYIYKSKSIRGSDRMTFREQ